MKFGGYRQVPLKSIIGPGDVKARQASPHVKALADDIAELGDEPINALLAKKTPKGWLLIAGRDRFSALLLNNARMCWVHVVVDATAQELHDLEVSENLHRRADDRNKLLAERVRKVTERIVAKRATSGTDVSEVRPAHRPKSAEGEAREIVAASLNMTPAAVKEAVRRELREGAAQQPNARSGEDGPPPIEAFAGPVIAALKKADAALRQAGAALEALALTNFDPAVRARLRVAVAEAGAQVRDEMPAHICPYCKGADVKCKPCGDRRYVTASVFDAAPPEKRDDFEESVHAAGLDAEPEPIIMADDCAHGYRDGGVPTGLCLHCGAAGAATWTAAEDMPRGDGPPPGAADPKNAGWVCHGPGSDRKVQPAAPAKKKRGMTVIMPGETEARPLDDVVAEVAGAEDEGRSLL